MAKQSKSSKIIKLLAIIIILAGLLLSVTGDLTSFAALLNSDLFTFSLGAKNFTLYELIKGVFFVIIILWGTSAIFSFSEKRVKKIKAIQSSNRALLLKAFRILLYFIAFLLVLDIFGIDLTALTIFSGAIGIGIGFGLQKITSNFISGIILLMEKSVKEGDLVELSDGVIGYIKSTRARYTLLETLDTREVLIPNEDFIVSRVTNWTYSNSLGRIKIDVGVSYDSDIELAHKLILEAAKEHPKCDKKEKPKVYLEEFADSSVNFILYFWVNDIKENKFKPRSDVLFNIWRKFKENNISIPFPQRDVHIKSQPK